MALQKIYDSLKKVRREDMHKLSKVVLREGLKTSDLEIVGSIIDLVEGVELSIITLTGNVYRFRYPLIISVEHIDASYLDVSKEYFEDFVEIVKVYEKKNALVYEKLDLIKEYDDKIKDKDIEIQVLVDQFINSGIQLTGKTNACLVSDELRSYFYERVVLNNRKDGNDICSYDDCVSFFISSDTIKHPRVGEDFKGLIYTEYDNTIQSIGERELDRAYAIKAFKKKCINIKDVEKEILAMNKNEEVSDLMDFSFYYETFVGDKSASNGISINCAFLKERYSEEEIKLMRKAISKILP